MWSLWNSRNDRKHGKTPIDPRSAIDWAMEACFQLVEVCPSGKINAEQAVKWQPLDRGTLKVDTDGAFLPGAESGATGAVLRDSNGNLRMASA